jgi:hypothetical protein
MTKAEVFALTVARCNEAMAQQLEATERSCCLTRARRRKSSRPRSEPTAMPARCCKRTATRRSAKWQRG